MSIGCLPIPTMGFRPMGDVGNFGKMWWMKFTAMVFGVALLLVAAFPPTDWVTPATEGMQIGDTRTAGNPERRARHGFTFIANVGGPVQIRTTQWFAQIGVLLALGSLAMWVASRSKGDNVS